ncbi:uncharacterized protein J3R85_017263 [Psidium guajava]|nr:uncharacterized protein J3R85_017263 [Psidium guajava]
MDEICVQARRPCMNEEPPFTEDFQPQLHPFPMQHTPNVPSIPKYCQFNNMDSSIWKTKY